MAIGLKSLAIVALSCLGPVSNILPVIAQTSTALSPSCEEALAKLYDLDARVAVANNLVAAFRFFVLTEEARGHVCLSNYFNRAVDSEPELPRTIHEWCNDDILAAKLQLLTKDKGYWCDVSCADLRSRIDGFNSAIRHRDDLLRQRKFEIEDEVNEVCPNDGKTEKMISQWRDVLKAKNMAAIMDSGDLMKSAINPSGLWKMEL